MVDLTISGGFDGPIEHGFSNVIFAIPAIITASLKYMVSHPNFEVVSKRYSVNRYPGARDTDIYCDVLDI